MRQSAALPESAAARDFGTDLDDDTAATAAEAADARQDQATPTPTRDKHEDKVKDLAEETASSRSGSNEAAFENSAVAHKKAADDGSNKEILTVMNERRSINKEDKERLREVSKKIKKCIRKKKKINKTTKNHANT